MTIKKNNLFPVIKKQQKYEHMLILSGLHSAIIPTICKFEWNITDSIWVQ